MRYFWRFLREDTGKMVGIGVLVLVSAAIPIALNLIPWVIGANWGAVQDQTSVEAAEVVTKLTWALAGFLSLALAGTGLRFLMTLWTAQVSQHFTERVRLAIFEKIGRLSSQTMSAQSIGALAHRSTGDVMRIQELLTPRLPEAVSSVAQLVLTVGVLLWLGPGFTLVALLFTPVVLYWMRAANRHVKDLSRETQRESEGIMNHFIDGVAGYRDLVASGRFDEASSGFARRLAALRGFAVRTSLWHYFAGMGPGLAFTFLTFGYYMLMTRDTSMLGDTAYVGKVVSFASIIRMAQGPVMSLTAFFSVAALSAPSFFEVRGLLERDEIDDAPPSRVEPGASLCFEDVSFRYAYNAPPILDHVSFDLEPGSFNAIVGQTGSGKTTLFHLMLRLIDCQQGAIRMGESRLDEIPLAVLRDHVGFIPQNPFIFDTTIRENILMGTPPEDVDPERMRRAVELSELTTLVSRRESEGGLDARVGPAGATLSGGERQRVALARLFLRDPKVIICDEYTANIDNATARLIQQALASRFEGHTRVVITHQLYTVRDADRILVLDRGRIVSDGSHEQLLETPGLYREMWEVQRLA